MQITYSLSIGGSEMVAKDLAIKLTKKNNNKVEVAAIEFGGELEKEFSKNNIPCHVIGRGPKEYIQPMLRFKKIFSQFKPDIVHTHHLHSLVYSAIPAKLAGAKIIHTEHEYFLLSAKRHKLYLRALSTLCEQITGVGHEITDFLKNSVHIPANKLTTITNGIDIQSFEKRKKEARAKYNIAPQEQVIGIVARLGKEKDHATLLESFRLSANTFPNLLLLVVGDGEERENLVKKCNELGIAPKVRFIGASNDIPNLLAAMDIFVLSSLAEGLPLSMLEAMASGLPIVTTNVGAIPSVIDNISTGLLAKPGDAKDISEKLNQYLSNSQLANSYAIAGKQLVSEKFNLGDTVEQYLALYNKSLGVE